MKCIRCGRPAVSELWTYAHPAHSLGYYCQHCAEFRSWASLALVVVTIAIIVLTGISIYLWGVTC